MSHTNYDFNKDHVIAQKTEQEIADFLKSKNKNIKEITLNNDNKYDLLIIGNDDSKMTVEIKEDFTCERTGNVGVEYECRGRPSGIAVSKADVYMYKIHQPDGKVTLNKISTEDLKQIIEDKHYFRTVVGGDVGSDSKCYLFKLDVFKKHCMSLPFPEKK